MLVLSKIGEGLVDFVVGSMLLAAKLGLGFIIWLFILTMVFYFWKVIENGRNENNL